MKVKQPSFILYPPESFTTDLWERVMELSKMPWMEEEIMYEMQQKLESLIDKKQYKNAKELRDVWKLASDKFYIHKKYTWHAPILAGALLGKYHTQDLLPELRLESFLPSNITLSPPSCKSSTSSFTFWTLRRLQKHWRPQIQNRTFQIQRQRWLRSRLERLQLKNDKKTVNNHFFLIIITLCKNVVIIFFFENVSQLFR